MKISLSLIILFLSFQFDVYCNPVEKEFIRSLEQVHEEKEKFLEKISNREDECLAKFFSGTCLEKLDIDYESGIRDLELKNQEILRKRREYRAEIRGKRRQRKMETKNNANPQ